MRETASCGLRIALALEKRIREALATPWQARYAQDRCSVWRHGSASLSSRQASSPSSPSRCKAAAVLKSAFVIPPIRTTGTAPLAEFAHSCLASISRDPSD
jgi:hypothetical protein